MSRYVTVKPTEKEAFSSDRGMSFCYWCKRERAGCIVLAEGSICAECIHRSYNELRALFSQMLGGVGELRRLFQRTGSTYERRLAKLPNWLPPAHMPGGLSRAPAHTEDKGEEDA